MTLIVKAVMDKAKKEKMFTIEVNAKQARILFNAYQRYQINFQDIVPQEDHLVIFSQLETLFNDLTDKEYANTEIEP